MEKRILQSITTLTQAKVILLNIGIFLAYIALGKLGLSVASINPSTTAIWAPTGVALAAFLLFGFRVVPAIFLGAFFVNFTTTGGVITSLGIALGNTLEGVVGAYLVKKFANGVHAFDRVIDIFKFTFLAAFISTMVSATLGVGILILGNLATVSQFWNIWFTWWLGDMGGNLIIAPLLLIWATHPRIDFNIRGAIHIIVVLAGLLLITQIVFVGILPYAYLCIPVGVWIAFWFGRRGASVATILVTVIAVVDTLHGTGPFVNVSTNQALLLLQLFLSIFSLTSLTFAALLLEFKRTEIIVRSQEKRFQALIEKSYDAFVLIDVTSKILYASPSVKRLLGYSPEELQGTVGFDLVIPDDRPMTMKELASLALRPGGAVTIEYRTVRKDKKVIWVEATGTNLLLDPTISAVVINFRDITEKKAIQMRLMQEKLTDEAMLGSIGDGIIATDNKGTITMINARGSEMLGWTERELVGKNIVTAIPLEDELGVKLTADERPVTKVLTLGKPIITSSTIFYVRKDGTKFPIHFTVTPIKLSKEVVGAIEVFHDITQEKEVDKAKSEFVSVASHQLRTPLATINWYLEELIANASSMTEKQSSYLKEVYSASKRMVSLINSLLNASRLELGTFIVESGEISIEDNIKEVLKDLRVKIEEKHLTISEKYQKNLPLMSADPKLFTIIMQNLIANAIKYTKPSDTILVEVTYNAKEYLITVGEHGYGIPKDQQSKIFGKLFRADNARMVEPEGTGLGLYIVKSIVATTGGNIWFESVENKKTTFFVSFPLSGMKQKKGKGKQLI